MIGAYGSYNLGGFATLLSSEVGPVVSDDTVRNAELVDDVEEEFDRLFPSGCW